MRSRQPSLTQPAHRMVLESILFWWLLSLIVAGALGAQIGPSYGTGLAGKAMQDPSLHIAHRLEIASEITAVEREEAVARLEALGVPATHAYLDRRGGRWATVVTSVPLVPGDGVGNEVTWPDVASRTAGPISWESAARSAFEAYLEENSAALAIDMGELERPARVTVHNGGDLIQIYIRRRVDGVPVRDTYLTAIVSHGNLILYGAHNWGDVRVETQPTVSNGAARATLSDYLSGYEMGGVRQKPQLLLIPTAAGANPMSVTTGEGYRYRLVWVLRPELAGKLGRWEALIDAHDGELLAFRDTVSYATTRKVVGGIYPVSNDGQAPDGVEQPGYSMPYADLMTPNGTLFTDGAGNYPVCVDGDVTTTLSGRYVRIEDFCGPTSESSSGDIDLGTSGGLDCEVPVGSDSLGNTHSARAAYFALNRIAEQARGYLPGNAWLQRQLTSVMNIPDFGYPEFNCNAFWDETTVNFFTSGSLPLGGPECNNTGELAGVVDHEWGHGLDDNDNLPTISNPGEGVADIYAALQLNDSCIARGFYTGQNYCGDTDPCTACDGVRDIDWAGRTSGEPHDLAWIDDEDNCAVPFLGDLGPCGSGIHCEGAVYAEAVWDLVQRDLQGAPFNMDLNTALEIGTRLTYLGAGNVGVWYTCANDGQGTGDGCNADGGYLNYLAADDDNGDLDDGTPHMEAIFAAFDRHGIACVSPTVQTGGCAGAPVSAPVVVATPLDRSVELSWAAVAGAVSYQIFRTEGVFGCDFGKTKVGETMSTSFVDEGLLNGTEYYYTVIPAGTTQSCTGPASACASVTPVGSANLGFDPSSVTLVPLNGDLDPFVDNCEEVQVVFDVANTGTGSLSNVELVDVQVLAPQAGISLLTGFPQSLASSLDDCAQASGSFSIRAEGLSFDETVELRVDVTADELAGQVKSHVIRITGTESNLESYASKTFSFESDMETWQTVTGTFDRSGVGGGANSTAFHVASSADLEDQCDAVRSPALRLSPSSTLEVSTQFDIEPSVDIEGDIFWFDRANVGVTEASTGERTPVSPDGGRLYNATGLYGSCGTQNQDGWADAMTAWATSTWSSTALQSAIFSDEFVHLDVRYGTDVDVQGFGLHFDEVTVTDVELVVDDSQTNQCEAGNQAPTVVDDPFVTTTAPVELDVLANDSDPDAGDSLRILGVTQPDTGTVVINSIGPDLDTLTYVPDAGPGRVDVFQYSVTDGRGGSALATVTVDFDVVFYDGFEAGHERAWDDSVGGSCDPDGTYTVTSGGPIQYQCCFANVNIDVDQFIFSSDGAEIDPEPLFPAQAEPMTGAGAACPAGSFNNVGIYAGGCTETYTLDGSFIDEDTWTGTFDVEFTGADCSCLDLDPCLDQSYSVTAIRP